MSSMMKYLLAMATVLALLVLAFLYIQSLSKSDPLDVEVGPLTVRNIASTEKLRVLSMRKEVLASQHRIGGGLLGNGESKIFVIYPATLHFGFDLSKCDTTSIQVQGDTVSVVLPPVEVLNRDGKAVDEAAKRTPIEQGDWSAKEMTALRERAEALMLRSCEYDSCYVRAERMGRNMVAAAISRLGYSHVEVSVKPRSDYGLCLIDKGTRNRQSVQFFKKGDLHYVLFNGGSSQKEARLYYHSGNIDNRHLLALIDCFTLQFAAAPRDVLVTMRGKDVFVMYQNTQIKVGSKEATARRNAAAKKDMSSLHTILSLLVFPGVEKVEIMETDKDGNVIYRYPIRKPNTRTRSRR